MKPVTGHIKLMVYEWKKLIFFPALWGFLCLCLVLNILVIFNTSPHIRDDFQKISRLTARLGQQVDGTFSEKLAEDIPSEKAAEKLLPYLSEMTDIYEAYDTDSLAKYYTGITAASPAAIRLISWKYNLLQSSVNTLAARDAAMDLYAGPATPYSHEFLFGTLIPMITAESILLGSLAILWLLGRERQNKTALAFAATCTGRKLQGIKILAGTLAVLTLYYCLCGISLGLYFTQWDYSGIWDASVSSQFNVVSDLLVQKPFLTWAPMTVARYLWAMLLMGGILVLIFTLTAAAAGTLISNTYMAALGLIAVYLAIYTALGVSTGAGFWLVYFILCSSPVSLWLSMDVWFTEMGIWSVIPWHETVCCTLNLVLILALVAFAIRRFQRKDMIL